MISFDKIDSRLKHEVGGFSPLRNKKYTINGRWMGNNKWLLIALNNYKDKTSKKEYDKLRQIISFWLKSL